MDGRKRSNGGAPEPPDERETWHRVYGEEEGEERRKRWMQMRKFTWMFPDEVRLTNPTRERKRKPNEEE
jgi:hypothetical protein